MPSCFVHTNFSARHGLLSTFNQRPCCTGNQCNHRLSASAASRVLKKKKIFKFLLFPPILLLWLTAYYYWQYFNVYVALRCGCGAVQVCFARGGEPETCKTTQELEDVDLHACPSIMCIQEATCCLQDLTCQCCPVHIMFWFCFSHFQGKKSAALTL